MFEKWYLNTYQPKKQQTLPLLTYQQHKVVSKQHEDHQEQFQKTSETIEKTKQTLIFQLMSTGRYTSYIIKIIFITVTKVS